MSNWAPVLAALVAVVGWYANHRLSVRAQKRNFRNQLLDRARMEIARGIHDYQRWLISVGELLHRVQGDKEYRDGRAREAFDWPGVVGQTDAFLNDPSAFNWTTALEEYEILFPETAAVRDELAVRQRHVVSALREMVAAMRKVERPDPEGGHWRAALYKRSLMGRRTLLAQYLLMRDLLVHLQNVSLHELFGGKREVPARVPKTMRDEVLGRSPDGQLVVTTSGAMSRRPLSRKNP